MFAAITFTSIDLNERILDLLLRLIISVLCGFIIGYERMARSKEAGVRTHTIVCFAAALIMIISKYAFGDATEGTRGADDARIAAQIVSGIGFVGAGIIFYRKNMLHGLTTAAGIWATAAIGMCLGAGMYIIGVASTAILVLLQLLLHRSFRRARTVIATVLRMTIRLETQETVDKVQEIFDAKQFLKFKTNNNGEEITADIELLSERNFTPQEIYEISVKYPFIKTLEKSDEL